MKFVFFLLLFSLLSCSTPDDELLQDSDEQTNVFVENDVNDVFVENDQFQEKDLVKDEIQTENESGLVEDEEVQDFFDNNDSKTDEDYADEDEFQDEDMTEKVFPECSAYKNPVSLVVFKDPELKEISGMSISYQNQGIIWVLNDSGCKATLYGLTFQGKIAVKLNLKGIKNIDWEALSLNPCKEGECLYIADTGDNLYKRKDYSIIKVVEPKINYTGTLIEKDITNWEKFPLSYEGNISKNTEAFAIDKSGNYYLFTKEISHTDVYKASKLLKTGTVFKKIGTIKTGNKVYGYPDTAQPSLVTGADINRNDDRLLLRTYGVYTTDNDGIREFRFHKGHFEEIFSQKPFMVPEGKDIQGESVAYNPFTGGYLHTSEFYHKVTDFEQHLWSVECFN